ncbi:WSC-domain-containing protein [Apiospora marii]|uniref:WSC-domain-containing protein n=1 Tax=Apiospora marii TaxID=335849 RepID=A0ABR1R1B1_9PEZI
MAPLLSTLTLLLAAATINSHGVLAQAPKPAAPPASFTGTPAVGSVVKDWKYLGCATEVDGRALTGPSSSNDTMTIESCQAFCTANNFAFAGVEYARECYCGRFVAPASRYVDQAQDRQNCSMPCKGNKNQFCGGSSRVSVFQNTNYKGPQPPKTVPGTSWSYVSCFMEPLYGRALTTLVKADDKMTVPMCTSACKGQGFAFAGLEYGRECWCGNTKSDALEDASDPQCAMQCDMPCGGDGNTICGGRAAIGIYKDGSKKAKRTVRRHEGHDQDAGHGGKRDHGGEHDYDEYRDYGHGPVNVDVGARKGRFVKVVRRSPDGQRQVEREEKVVSL